MGQHFLPDDDPLLPPRQEHAQEDADRPPPDGATAETTSYAAPDDAKTSPFPVGQTIGRHTVRKQLGRGGFGTVYLAQDEELQRTVAVKVPRWERFKSGEEIDRFLEEARTVAKLRHPAIVAVYDLGRQEDGTPFVVMEYIDGRSLKELLESERPSHSRAVELIVQAADVVHYAHKQGFVHRDLKPGNILLDSEGKPHVADFGLAVHESVQRLRAGEYSGTLRYMAPEQVRGETHRLDGRTDVWALGVILYEMLTGRRPFSGDSREQLADEILHRDPKPPRQIADKIPEELQQICLKCLSKQLTERYGSAADLAKDLRRWQRPRRRLIAMVSAAVLLLVVVFSVFAAWRLRHAPPEPLPVLSGTIDVLVWSPGDGSRRGLGLRDRGALPLRPNDQIRVGAQLNRPAYMYLVWIDAEGIASPVHPWTPGRWTQRPPEESPTDRLSLPEVADKGWPMQAGPAGMETLVLLARESPLPDEVDLAELLAGLPRQQMKDPQAVVWFADGKVITEAEDSLRAPKFFTPQQIDDPVLQTQRLIQERLRPHFTLNRAVSFAARGETP